MPDEVTKILALDSAGGSFQLCGERVDVPAGYTLETDLAEKWEELLKVLKAKDPAISVRVLMQEVVSHLPERKNDSGQVVSTGARVVVHEVQRKSEEPPPAPKGKKG